MNKHIQYKNEIAEGGFLLPYYITNNIYLLYYIKVTFTLIHFN